MRTDALMLAEDLSLTVGSRDHADPVPGEALVRVEWAGVCGSDLHVLSSGAWVTEWPATLGHEVVGIVPCPEHVEPELAVLAEPLAVAMHAVGKIAEVPDHCLLLGYGPIGALCHLELTRRRPDVRVTVREPMPARRRLADALGAEPDPGADGAWPLVVDAAGYGGSLLDGVRLTRNGGRLLLVALNDREVPISSTVLVEKSLTVIGAHGFDRELPQALDLLAAEPARYRPLITDAVLLEEAPARLRSLAERPVAGKLVIRPWQD